ncbi:MAG TPA: S41 family peptidase [Chloroflexota bacterium]|jgi:carboxyl-terminal processing protease|nr:S41 family peptidase [Chloroflexota bacterium]
MLRRIAPLLAACFLLSACGPALTAVPRYGSPPAEAQLIQSEYDALLGGYVLPLDPSVLGLAAATGMRDAIAEQMGAAAAARFPYATFGDSGSGVRTQIAQEYVAARQQYPTISSVTLAHDAMASMAQSINDCHTNFFTAAQYQEQQAELAGSVQFGGIGASLTDRPGSTPLINEVFAGLPAAQAGLQRGDAITRVNDLDVQGRSASAVVALIRGPVGSVVNLDVQRYGKGTLHFAITRQDVAPPAVSSGTIATGAGAPIGYVHIYGFTSGMPAQLQQVLQQFSQRGSNEWIIDLRDNSGGTLQALVQTASLFIAQGPLAAFEDRSGQTQQLTASGQAALSPQKVVLLVNHESASASEIFAAAMQERAATPVVGSTTAGCVAVGKFQRLADGSAVEYAVDKVSTPVQHRLLNGAGVTPNVPAAMTLDDLAANKDPQLAAAVAVIGGQTAPTGQSPLPSPTPTGAAGKLIPGAVAPAGT